MSLTRNSLKLPVQLVNHLLKETKAFLHLFTLVICMLNRLFNAYQLVDCLTANLLRMFF